MKRGQLFGVCISAPVILLSGCDMGTSDFKEIEVSRNRIHARGQDKPFSGKLRSIPLSAMPTAGLKPLANLISTTTRTKVLEEFLTGSSTSGEVLCTVQIQEGPLHGDAVCKFGDLAFLNTSFVNGAVEGGAELFDMKNKRRVAEAMLVKGQLNGQSILFNSSLNEPILTVNWKNGEQLPTK